MSIKKPSETFLGDGWTYTEVKPKFKCKHGKEDCDRCGQYRRTDYKHTTVGGKGLIAQQREREKKR